METNDIDSSIDTGATIQAEFDWNSVAPSTGVIETVSITANVDPSTLEPLYGAVDPDALDALVQSTGTRSQGNATTVSFTFVGYDVSVRSDGTVAVRPVEEDG